MPGLKITDILGAVPAADSRDYVEYVRKWRKHRLAELQFTPDVTKYVSPSGNDSNAGTLEAPYATIQKARDVRAADLGNSYLIRIQGNQTYRIVDAAHLWSVPANTRIGTYGTGRPTITRALNFTTGWTVVSGTRYKRTVTGTPHRVFRANRHLELMYEADSEANATLYRDHPGVNGGWYFAGGELFIDIGVDPNGVSLEVTFQNAYHGFLLTDDLTSVENCLLLGFGDGNSATQCQGVTINVQNLDRSGCINVGSYGGGTHSLALTAGAVGNADAIVLFDTCECGASGILNPAETQLNIYQNDGGTEALIYNPHVPIGTLPSFRWYNPASPAPRVCYRSAAIFSHVAGGRPPMDRVVVYIEPGFDAFPDRYFAPDYDARTSSAVGRLNLSSDANYDEMTTHVVNSKFIRKLGQIFTSNIFPNLHKHACVYDVIVGDSAFFGITAAPITGVFTACIYRFDAAVVRVGTWGVVNANNAQSSPLFINCQLTIENHRVAGEWRLNRDGETWSTNWQMHNCVLGLINSTVEFWPALPSGQDAGCLYIGPMKAGSVHRAAGEIDFSQISSLGAEPAPGDARYRAGTGLFARTDITGKPFSTDIGPLSSAENPAEPAVNPEYSSRSWPLGYLPSRLRRRFDRVW